MNIKSYHSIVFFSVIIFCWPSLNGEEAKSEKIDYITGNIPSVPFNPYKGQSYEEMVPATFDIAERAALAINALTGSTDPSADYELYWLVHFNRNSVVMNHDLNDWVGLKFMETLPLLRVATGSERLLNVDKVWQDVTLKSIGPDGLYYIPLKGRPWATAGLLPDLVGKVAKADGTITTLADPNVRQFTHPYVNGRIMQTMIVYYLRDKNPIWLEKMKPMVDRLLELAIHKDDYCYFPALYYEPNAKYDKAGVYAKMPQAIMGGELNGRVIEAAARLYKLTGYEPARELAEKQSRFMRYHDNYWDKDGKFLAEKHFHAHAIYMLGMLEYAKAVNDKELLNWLSKSYEWAKSSEAGSSSLMGFFQELINPEKKTCEACGIADMIALALKFSDAGVNDYYEDAERWSRNHFAESQLTSCDWVYCNSERQPITPVQSNETADNVCERNIGAFAGWSSANDWGINIMHCCTATAARSIYYIWQHTLNYKDGPIKSEHVIKPSFA